jgi:hypothetical protein
MQRQLLSMSLTTDLLEQFNIEIIHQAAQSLETNVLDLGLWQGIQSSAEQIHNYRAMFSDAIALSVNEAWENLLTSESIASVSTEYRFCLT